MSSILCIFKLTFKEILQLSYLWYILLASVAAIEILPAFELLHFGNADNAILNVLQASVFSAVLFTIIIACYTLLGRELNQKIAMNLFTKPISFRQVLLGKYFALVSIISLQVLLLGLGVFKQAWVLNWESTTVLHAVISLWSVFLQGIMLLSLSILMTIVFGSLAGLFLTISFIMLSYCLPPGCLFWFCVIIPPLPWFDITPVYFAGGEIAPLYVLFFSVFAVAYSAFMIELGSKFLERREF